MKYFLLIGLCSAMISLHAQQAYQPNHQELIHSYQHAALLDSTASKKVFRSSVRPQWTTDGKSFWYRINTSENTWEYLLVDLTARTKNSVFDHRRLADALSKLTGKKTEAGKLPVENLSITPGNKKINILADKKWYTWDTGTNELLVSDQIQKPSKTKERSWRRRQEQRDSVSPDQKFTAMTKNGNIYIRSKASGQETQFTRDGSPEQPYGEFIWSPDSKTLIAYKINYKEDKKVYYILSSSPGTTRGELKSQNYMQPGDEFSTFEMYLINPEKGTSQKAAVDKFDIYGTPEIHWRKGNNQYFTFEKRDRGHQRFRIIEIHIPTAATKTLIDEKTNTFIYEQRIFTHYLPDTHELIWATEKDGYRHLYLMDELTGKEKNRITTGNWVVREIDSVDTQRRQIWFRANGMDPSEDPYFIHYYRIGFNGKGLVQLTPAKGNHNLAFSPDKSYYLDTWSQVNVPPVTTLNRTSDGKKIMDLEKADISAFLKTGIPLPEVFVAKGRDGKTDIWGIVCRPSHLDSTKTYPIIENIYAGPQDSFVPKSFLPYSEMQSLAELGFIVVQCDGMGTANRSKAFHDVCWKNLADAGFEDRILWMKALGKKHRYADTTRVGIYGTSAGGQNAGGSVLFHPEFYKSAVAACGCHDNRVDKQWWNEQWMGYPVGPHYEAQSNITNAAKLRGNLLLIVGEADTNVPPESTYRFADALIKAGKNFELITVPGLGHSDGGPFGKNKKRDFFVKTLLGIDPVNRNNGELTHPSL